MPIRLDGSTGITVGTAVTVGTSDIRIGDNVLNTSGQITASETLSFQTADTERLSIDASGNVNLDSGGVYYDAVNNRVAIGFTSPGVPLEVRATTSTGQVQIIGSDNTNATWRLATPSASVVAFGGANTHSIAFGGFAATTEAFTERARLTSSGQILVGTSSARSIGSNFGTVGANIQVETNDVATLSVVSNKSDTTGPHIVFGKSRSGTAGGNTIVQNGDNLGVIIFAGADGTDIESRSAVISAQVDGTPGANDMPGRLVFSTTADGAASPTERMRITSNGQLGTFTAAANDALYVSSGEGAGTTYRTIQSRYGATGNFGGTISFNVFTNGNVQNTNNSYGALSDIKLKENIVDANSQWNDLKSLQVRNYNFKEGQTHTQIGLVAQEVELVSPGLVYESPDRDEDGNDLGTVTKSVNYSVLYMKAVKALQEAMERIETLESENSTLKNDFISLENRIAALEGN